MAVLLYWSSSGTSWAQQPASRTNIEKARTHNKEGTRLFESGDHEGAIREFELAYELTKAPGVLFNLATVLLEAKRCRKAAERFEQFAKADPNSPLHDEAIDQAAKARGCEREAEHQKASAIAAASRPRVAPPVVARSGESNDRAGGPSTLQWLAIGVSSAGLAMAGTGVVFGLKSNSDAEELDRRFADGGTWDAEADALENRHKRNKTRAYVFTGVGVGIAAAGAGLLIWDLLSGRSNEVAPITAQVSTNEFAVFGSLRFD